MRGIIKPWLPVGLSTWSTAFGLAVGVPIPNVLFCAKDRLKQPSRRRVTIKALID
jgi:hypothetical protein